MEPSWPILGPRDTLGYSELFWGTVGYAPDHLATAAENFAPQATQAYPRLLDALRTRSADALPAKT